MRRLASQTVVYGISTVLVKLINYILTPYLTRILGAEQYGEVTHLYSLMPFLLVLLTMGLESGYFRFAGKAANQQEKRDVFATSWGIVGLFSVLFFVVVLLFNRPIAEGLSYGAMPSFVWLTAAITMLDALVALPFARLREQGRPGLYVKLRLVSVVVNLFFCVFFYSWLPSLAASGGLFAGIYNPAFGVGYVLVANLIGSIVTFILIMPFCGGILPKINKSLAKTILLYSMPLLLSGIAGTANEFIDRQMLLWLAPGDAASAKIQLGYYGAVLKLGVVMTLFTTMYRLAAEPFFLAEFKNDDFRKANAEALKYFVIVSISIFLLITLFVDGFELILGPKFRVGVSILPLILLSNMFSGIVLNLSFWYKQTGATKYAIYVTGSGLLFTVVFNIMLVPTMGYVGAAVARLICESVMVVISYFLNRKYYPVPYNLMRIGSYFLIGGAIYGVSLLFGGISVLPKYLLYSVLIVIFVVYALRREHIDIKKILHSALHRN